MKRIGVLTSGGDAPGMNAAIRAVVRAGPDYGFEVFGVRSGYRGLIAGDFIPLGARDVGGIIQRGGTMLGSARSEKFKTEEGRREALLQLEKHGIEALVTIGGNGTQAGSHALSKAGFPVIGIASTIDNDLYGSDITIGVDTALNIALEAIDRLKVTASSHQRAFAVEVMGRNSGYLALMVGITGGAEAIAIPEADEDPEHLASEIRRAYERGKPHALVVVAEGARYNAEALAHYFEGNRERFGFELRITILGHVQRGGSPTYFDRMLGSLLGAAAVKQLAAKRTGVLIGLIRNDIAVTPLEEVAGKTKPLDPELIKLANVLAK